MHICGIQQVGIGVTNVEEAWKWYRKYFGVNIKIFDEKAPASLMTKYTGNIVQERHAVYAINMQGGGGFEIWQFTQRIPQDAAFELLLGDLGIFSVKIKTSKIESSFKQFNNDNELVIGNISDLPQSKNRHFFVQDPYKNIFELVEFHEKFMKTDELTGGVLGVNIGVSNMDKSISFYNQILGFNEIVYDKTGVFDDLKHLPGGTNSFRRVLLKHKETRKGFLSRIFGPSEIELFQVLDRQPNTIYSNRYWGDKGFIHICFDIYGMHDLKKLCAETGYPFTVDSESSFKMEKAAGQFAYIEDPDITLIEFVETHKIPVLKKIGWYLNLKKLNPNKPLPDWMLKFLKYSAVKE